MKLRSLNILVFLLLLLAGLPSRAELGVEGKQVLEVFRRLSVFDRRSGRERAVREWILAEAARAKGSGTKVSWQTDRAGNVLLRLEGTGRFRSQLYPMGLQAHLDMVGTVKGLLPGQDPDPYFAQGIKLMRRGDWLQSVDNLTTIGADNGIGVAMALRYLFYPEIEHPPLEILLTVEEETTFAGARGVRFLLTSPVLINLDGEKEDEVWTGSMGNASFRASLRAKALTELPRVAGLRIELTGLKGGHSAMAVHYKRVNAALAGMHLLTEAQAIDPGVILLSFASGTEGITNVLPSSLVIELQPSGAGVAESLRSALHERWNKLLAEATDEDRKAIRFRTEPMERIPAEARGLTGRPLGYLASTTLGLINGVTAHRDIYPNGIKTSSNLSYLYVSPEKSGDGISIRLSTMARSFEGEDQPLAKGNERRLRTLARALPEGAIDFTREKNTAWLDDKNWVLPVLKRLDPQKVSRYVDGSLETSVLAARYPGRPILSFGPDIRDPHENTERVSLSSTQRTTVLLDRLLATLPQEREFQLACRTQLDIPAEAEPRPKP